MKVGICNSYDFSFGAASKVHQKPQFNSCASCSSTMFVMADKVRLMDLL